MAWMHSVQKGHSTGRVGRKQLTKKGHMNTRTIPHWPLDACHGGVYGGGMYVSAYKWRNRGGRVKDQKARDIKCLHIWSGFNQCPQKPCVPSHRADTHTVHRESTEIELL